MTKNENLKCTQQFKTESFIPKTYEQFVLEDGSSENLYPELIHQDIGSQKGYGPTSEVNITSSSEIYFISSQKHGDSS